MGIILKGFAVCSFALVAPLALWAQVNSSSSTLGGLDPAEAAELVLANHIHAHEELMDGYGHFSVRDTGNPIHYFTARSLETGAVMAADIIVSRHIDNLSQR